MREKNGCQPSRIKLLEFITVFAIGGTERHVANLAKGLDGSRFELSFACLRRWGPYLREIEALEIPLAEYNIHRLYNPQTLQAQLRFARHLKRSQIQIVHTYGFYPHVFAIPAAKLAGVPVVVASIRDMGAYLTPIRKRVQRFVCRWADCILVNAEAVKQWLIAEGFDSEKIAVIGNGIDLSIFTKNGADGTLRRELGLPARAPVVAVLSRLSKIKGIDYFLEAAAMVAGRFPQARFLIIGDDDDRLAGHSHRKELEEHADRLGLRERVVFTGFRPDVPELLSLVTISVLPSLTEGLSNTLLESMAAGVPVVTTRVGGNPEAVLDGETGLLVPPRDPAAMARAICLLLENPEMAFAFGRAGRQRVAEHFSLERMARETEELYLGLMEKAKQGHSRVVRSREVEISPS